ncbi:MAG: hypothetical protein V4586_20445 [Pseudomonadota bacterium]
MQHLTVHGKQEIDAHLGAIYSSSERTYHWIKRHSGSPMELFRAVKFDPMGIHPLAGRALNVIEQVIQTATYLVAIEAARLLFDLHPRDPRYVIARGAYMSHPPDIMSITEGNVGAETFAAVDPRNNNKLKKDLMKFATRAERSRTPSFRRRAIQKRSAELSLRRKGS